MIRVDGITPRHPTSYTKLTNELTPCSHDDFARAHLAHGPHPRPGRKAYVAFRLPDKVTRASGIAFCAEISRQHR